MPDDHGILTWIVRFAGVAYRRFSVGKDGRSPSERILGRKCRHLMAEFGEAVHWTPASPGKRPSLEARTEDGYYFGPVEGTNE